MTQSKPNLDDVRRRRQEIIRQIDGLKAEEARLRTAEQVLQELAGQLKPLSDYDAVAEANVHRLMVNGGGETIVSLIEMVLHSRKRWLVAQEIQREVSRLKGAEVPMATISQTLHYLKGKGRIVRNGLRVRAQSEKGIIPYEKGSAGAEPDSESDGGDSPSDHVAG